MLTLPILYALNRPLAPTLAVAAKPTAIQTRVWALLRKRVKHVFVLYQENRSFDHYFGTFPGAEGLFSHPDWKTPGFYQPLVGLDGQAGTVHPFRIGPKEFAADTDDVDHSHEAIVTKMHVVAGAPLMDRFALWEEQKHSKKDGPPSLAAHQFGELAMAYVDGDTIPFLWQWANRFTLCDHIFQTITGPSTPGNLTIIAAQTGMTQWILHPGQATPESGRGPGVPMVNDANPFWGSSLDKTKAFKMPYGTYDDPTRTPQYNLTFAALPLTLSGSDMPALADSDRDADGDLGDINDDVAYLKNHGHSRVPWGWYEEGFDKEPSDVHSDDPLDAEGRHASYITHHNGPQYFGFIANNPKMSRNLHGLDDFYKALDHHALPSTGVFYVKGGSENIMGLHPADPDPRAQKNFLGDDDHPGYSDAQISEAMLAETVNKIVKSGYWKDSAIIITWDDSEGDYDHVVPPFGATDPYGKRLSDGPRVPMIILSPFAKTHSIFKGVGDQASVVKFVDHLFNLTPLADLPVEKKARAIGAAKGIANAGPRDDLTAFVTDLSGAFDLRRLAGLLKPLPGSYATIPESLVHVLPQQSGYGLKQLGIVPTDRRKHIKNEIPADFNPRPGSTPTKVPAKAEN